MALEFTKYEGKRTTRFFSLIHSCDRVFKFLSSIGDQGREIISSKDINTGYGTTDIRFRVNATTEITNILNQHKEIFQEYQGRRSKRYSAQFYNTEDLYLFLLRIGDEGRKTFDALNPETGYSPCDIRIRINSTPETDNVIANYTLLEFGDN